ncbi:IS4 family transposase, partial [Streptomyces sp. NPDC059863]|uniref:IS4 family transposase n=1 Tax=unclassified Streptomyces TaxID=2593676 RepID=UPI0036696CC0
MSVRHDVERLYAPGHLGELTRHVPVELVDAVLGEHGVRQRRLRLLPSRVGVYLLLAMGLFEQVSVAGVWRKLCAGLPGRRKEPSEKALRDLRRRIGPAPLKGLFDVVAGPLAGPSVPGVGYGRWRTVAFDGCSSIKVPDTDANRGRLGKLGHVRGGTAGYPMLGLMALVETGTRGILGACFGRIRQGETVQARGLLHLLDAGMLLLADRAFDGVGFLGEVRASGAEFLVRLSSSRRWPQAGVLADGSRLCRAGTLTLRVIEADLRVLLADGSTLCEHYRLATTLTDPRRHPADRLVRLYHERWEIESTFLALKHTLLAGRVLRSGDPAGIAQEMWALLTLYQVLRTATADAVSTRPGTDPDRAGFTIAVHTARDQVVLAAQGEPDDLRGEIGQAVLGHLLPPRRPRISTRKVKSPLSRYHASKTSHPATTTPITEIQIHLQEPARRPPSLHQRVQELLHTQPGHPWHLREIAQALGLERTDYLRQQLTRATRHGWIQKTTNATYTTPLTTPNTP